MGLVLPTGKWPSKERLTGQARSLSKGGSAPMVGQDVDGRLTAEQLGELVSWMTKYSAEIRVVWARPISPGGTP